MEHQGRLYREAVDALSVSAHYEMGRGWVLAFAARRGDECWDEARQERYECLSTAELADVVQAELTELLGL